MDQSEKRAEAAYRCPACRRPVDHEIYAVIDTLWPDSCDTCGWHEDEGAPATL